MSFENQLIEKTYYETFMKENKTAHPVRVLGEAYLEEQKNELSDLAYIRFAQGEVYYHNKDFEAAIFKWENITNELEPWAKKNTADAYCELGLLPTARDLYRAVQTDNVTLKMEVELQLFSLYIQQGKHEEASKVIKNAVLLHPDYPGITDIARAFFEDLGDYKSAVELAINEAIRTESLQWFEILKSYVEQGSTRAIAPDYFSEVLTVLYGVDEKNFEKLVVSLWHSYRQEDTYFAWLKTVNSLLSSLAIEKRVAWRELSVLHRDTYFELISGQYMIKKLHNYIPKLLANWVRIADSSNAMTAATGVLAWSEVFPSGISSEAVAEAEQLIGTAPVSPDVLDDTLALFDSIMAWASEHDLDVGYRIKWMIRELMDSEARHLLIAGTAGNGKTSFVNAVLGEKILEEPSAAVILFRDEEDTKITEVTDADIKEVSSITDFDHLSSPRRQPLPENSFIDFRMPSPFLRQNRLVLMNTPGLSGANHAKKELLRYLPMADSLLFVLDAGSPFTDRERDLLLELRDQEPALSIHFILNKIDRIQSEKDAVKLVDETWSRINVYFPEAKVFTFSSQYDKSSQLRDLAEFVQAVFSREDSGKSRTAKLLFLIRKSIAHLLEKRAEQESELIDSINRSKEMTAKLNGAINQLSDLEQEKTKRIRSSFHSMKEEIRNEMNLVLPDIIRDCSELLSEDSDFGKIHLELNEEMNKRIRVYLQEKILPKFYLSFSSWLDFSKEEFTESQVYLDEMAESFNALYSEDRLKLECDFRVLDDWQRDADRMTSAVHLEKVNILLRLTPSQFILKSAGKIFGAIPQNRLMLYNRYKTFLENEDYTEAVESITDKFFQQFELFENGLGRDIAMFFRNPHGILNQAVEETETEIRENEERLGRMRENPEVFRDPLTLFELKLRQFEWMTEEKRQAQQSY